MTKRGMDFELNLDVDTPLKKDSANVVKINKTFRLMADEAQWLDLKSKELSQQTGQRISQGRLLRGLILLAKKTKDINIIKACRDVL